ncbi:MAG: helix-turn-helix domain-containing protein [Phycisphaeraceae bacterium]|nr:helix-turn-helix domain-containing protein [Phycisphaeraceae bacterium]
MGSVGERIRSRRVQMGMTLERLAQLSDCTKGYLSQIENGRRENPPSEALLSRLECALMLTPGSLVELARWTSAPGSIRTTVSDLQRRSRALDALADRLRERGVDALHASGELEQLIGKITGGGGAGGRAERSVSAPIPLPVQVPVINSVQAGYPTEFTDMAYPARVADSYVSAPDVMDPDAFAARVVGDSMSPAYREGDIVVFSPERDTPPGSDCFVRFERDGETTFKRVYFEVGDGGRELIRLQPLNSAYAPRVADREEIAGLYAAVYVVRAVG